MDPRLFRATAHYELLNLAKNIADCMLKKEKINAEKVLHHITKLIKKGASLNSFLDDRTLMYVFCLQQDIHFVTSLLALGGDPRIVNLNKTNLFSPACEGRSYFMRACWYGFTNFEFGTKEWKDSLDITKTSMADLVHRYNLVAEAKCSVIAKYPHKFKPS